MRKTIIKDKIYRYTKLASAIDILRTNELTLLSPINWSDRNDIHYVEEFRRRMGYKSVHALCFTVASETAHHWAMFAGGQDGVRIQFDPAILSRDIERNPALQLTGMTYMTIKTAEQKSIAPSRLPFVKRWPYRAEKEVRILHASEAALKGPIRIPISPEAIVAIKLSPELPEPLKATMRQTVKNAIGNRKVSVVKSSLLENERWLNAISD